MGKPGILQSLQFVTFITCWMLLGSIQASPVDLELKLQELLQHPENDIQFNEINPREDFQPIDNRSGLENFRESSTVGEKNVNRDMDLKTTTSAIDSSTSTTTETSSDSSTFQMRTTDEPQIESRLGNIFARMLGLAGSFLRFRRIIEHS